MKTIISIFLATAVFSIWARTEELPLIDLQNMPFAIYPQTNDTRPDLPSPFRTTTGDDYVVAAMKEGNFAIMPVTLNNDSSMCPQLIVNTLDFPSLATGLHNTKELVETRMITGRSLAEITDLGRPGQLSEDGFMSANEDILSLLVADNRIVSQLGLTHPQMATPLFHLLNMMDMDLKLGRWNSRRHEWQNVPFFFYNNQKVYVEAHDTKGGQLSIFDDGIKGAFWMIIKRALTKAEKDFLDQHYSSLTPTQKEKLAKLLCEIYTGEMEPQYIMRYGFYEGHAGWRADPITIAFVFGLKSLEEIEAAFPGQLYEILTAEFTRDYVMRGRP